MEIVTRSVKKQADKEMGFCNTRGWVKGVAYGQLPPFSPDAHPDAGLVTLFNLFVVLLSLFYYETISYF